MLKKSITTLFLILLSALLYFSSPYKLPHIDQYADTYFSETTTQAAVAYATVRGVNGVISVLKESQISFSPAGVGISIAAGQILDPIDDMTERLSTVIVTAIVSLGLQKILLEIGELVSLKGAAATLLFLIIPIWFGKTTTRYTLVSLIVRITFFLIIFRLFLPTSSYISNSLYTHLLADEIVLAEQKLAVISEKYKTMQDMGNIEKKGFISSFSEATKQRIEDTRNLFHSIAENIDDFIEALLTLTVLYVSLFLLQVIAIPVAMFWLMLKLVDILLRMPPLQILSDHQIKDNSHEKSLSA